MVDFNRIPSAQLFRRLLGMIDNQPEDAEGLGIGQRKRADVDFERAQRADDFIQAARFVFNEN